MCVCVCVCVIQGRHRGARVIGTDRSFDMKYHKSGRHCDELGLTVMPQGAAFGHIGSNFAVFARHGRCHDADDNNGTGCNEKVQNHHCVSDDGHSGMYCIPFLQAYVVTDDDEHSFSW